MIKTFSCGLLDTNTYVVWDEDTHIGMIIDCGVDPQMILKFTEENEIKIKYVVLTHGHFDHADFIEEYEKIFVASKIVCHENELCVLDDIEANLSIWGKHPRAYKCNYTLVKEGDILSLCDESRQKSGDECMNFEVLHTPGHTPGCICLYCKSNKIMFTGDTLFKRSYGRTDFKYGNSATMYSSLKRLYSMDKDITFYPGHYESSTIGDEI